MPEAELLGRDSELAAVRGALQRAGEGHGGVVLVAGEAGIGKTRLVQAVAAAAECEGFAVSWGRGWEGGGAPAFWLWRQLLRSHVTGLEDTPASARLAAALPLVGLVAPEVAAGTGTVSSVDVGSPGGRFALFDAVATVIEHLAVSQPQLLVMEDVHATDASSMALLQFVHRELMHSRVLLIATYRDLELRLQPAIHGALAEITPALRLQLAGLDQHGLALLVKETAGTDCSERLALALEQLTGGNPLFTEEVIMLLAADGRLAAAAEGDPGPLPVPDSARAVIRRRLEQLGAGSRHVISVASVLGQEAPLPLLAATAGVTADEIVAHMNETDAIGLLTPSGGPMTYRFRHAVLREALYEELDHATRRALHLRAADAIEALHGHDLLAHRPALAHHLVSALPLGEPSRALVHLREAAAEAMRSLAFSESAALLRQALDVGEFGGMGAEDRAETLLNLGDALRRDGELAGALREFRAAATLGRSIGRSDLLARAALAYGSRIGGYVESGQVDTALLSMLEEALGALPEGDNPLRVRVLARLAYEMVWVPGASDRREAISAEALAMARRLGDGTLLVEALLIRRLSCLGVLDLATCDELHRELVERASRIEEQELTLHVLHAEVVDALSHGDRRRHAQAVERYREGAERLRIPALRFYAMLFGVTADLLDGNFAAAELKTAAAADFGMRHRHPSAEAFFWICQAQVWRGRMAPEDIPPCLDACRQALRDQPRATTWRPAEPLILALIGEEDEARRICDHIVAHLHEIERDYNRPSTLCLLADALSFVDAGQHAQVLQDELRPYAGRYSVIANGLTVYSPVDRGLGAMARLLGDLDQAARHLDQAVAMDEGLGCETSLVFTLLERARVEAARHGPGSARLEEDRRRALSIMQRLGIGTLPAAYRRLLPDSAHVSRDGGVLRCQGDFWVVERADRSALVKDSKGIRHLARLMAEPGRELHVVELAAGRAARSGRSEQDPTAGDDLGPVLDSAAKAAYRKRWEELSTELQEAEDHHDLGRAERVREEMDLLAEELSRAVGLGGRDRRPGSTAERARVNVTRAIRTAIARIGEHDRELGRHLDASVRTGTYCCYQPPDESRFRWTVEAAG